ncbi:hypothetical protein PybrP1_004683 [[Pythium] brassicae (nom. inval.)]|nr:hypothetical protein PybrP1_004683 [[Pythium] brassicae (nom. inval.)]
MPTEHELRPLLAHVEAFARIVNAAQTRQLLEWDAESLQRALQWARFLERGTRASGDAASHALDSLLRVSLPAVTLPSFARDEVMTTRALQNASQHLARSLLQSPFLAVHPLRSELLLRVLKQARESTAWPAEEDGGEPRVDVSHVLTERIVQAQKAAVMAAIAQTMSDGCAPIRVQVLSYSIAIAPSQSYALRPRTLELKTVARALQQNAVNAQAKAAAQDAPDAYAAFLSELTRQFRESASVSGGGDVREAVALMVAALEWPDDETQRIQNDVRTQILEAWVVDAPHGLWELPPWLSAMLAAHSPAIRSSYVAALCARGFLEPHAHEFGVRVATLMMQSSETETQLCAALRAVDPLVLQRHFDCI